MVGFKVTIENLKGQRISCFSGYIKTLEDAKKYAEWVGSTARIKAYERNVIKTYAVFDESSCSGLRYL